VRAVTHAHEIDLACLGIFLWLVFAAGATLRAVLLVGAVAALVWAVFL